jgi:hypothetical protein
MQARVYDRIYWRAQAQNRILRGLTALESGRISFGDWERLHLSAAIDQFRNGHFESSAQYAQHIMDRRRTVSLLPGIHQRSLASFRAEYESSRCWSIDKSQHHRRDRGVKPRRSRQREEQPAGVDGNCQSVMAACRCLTKALQVSLRVDPTAGMYFGPYRSADSLIGLATKSAFFNSGGSVSGNIHS